MMRPLRIFLSCQQDVELLPVPAYRFWVHTFRAALAEAGHTCLEVPGLSWATGLLPAPPEEKEAWRSAVWQEALAWIRREHARQPIDLFLGYLYPDQVQPAAIRELQALGLPCVNFFCDNVRLFRRAPAAYGCFDLNWVPENKAGPFYEKAQFPWIAAPMPCWVEPRWRSVPTQETLPPTFVGTRDETREQLFAEALGLGAHFELRGTGWHSGDPPVPFVPRRSERSLLRNQLEFAAQHGVSALLRKLWGRVRPPAPVSFNFDAHVRPAPRGDDYWTVLRESQVCLGVNRYPSLRFPAHRPDRYSRLRDLEAPMAGACYLTEWAPELASLYEIGREIEVYRDAAELRDRLRALTADPARRQSLRAAGQRRALQDHSVGRTLERIAARLALT